MHQDLNDLYYYVQVVEHGGFAPAGRALGMPKSKLSRRIALLEERLGVRLLQRSTRRFAVTELGQAYYARCKAVMVEAEAAQEVIEATHAGPCGVLRVACPGSLLQGCVGAMLVSYAMAYPAVTMELTGLNREVDLVAEGVDLALRMRPAPLTDSDLAIRILAYEQPYLVAAPALVREMGEAKSPVDLARWPSLGHGSPIWELAGPDGARAAQRHTPRLVTDDLTTLRRAAEAGMGVVELPSLLVQEQIAAGTLVRVLPEWTPRVEIIHAAFPTRRGLIPSVRVLIDHLAAAFGATERPGHTTV
ncbi:MAG TPA: LysR substrate-binding domain-containing protein [Bryobacteraceae bacterium]|nr:LysR substrate-binding domain-containing protein [Bryobacteraceae bacterium]